MECPRNSGQEPELFIAYAAESLPPATSRALERHMAVCAECRRTAEDQRRVWSALDSWEPEFISGDFDRKVYARIAAEGQRSVRHANWALRPALPIAAVCAVVLAGYLLREPAVPQNPSPRVDMEQVERALDDIDMLNKMGVASQD